MRISISFLLARATIVVAWIAVIFAFLYVPRIMQFGAERKSISLFIWPMILDAKIIKQFEQQTGTKVYINYYESNEELLSKLRATQGKGFDLIVPTDYMVEKLIQEGLLKKLDKNRLPFIATIKPYFLGNYFDPANEYSIPYYLSIFGLGINKNYFKDTALPTGWSAVFNPQSAIHNISMIDSAREAIMLASYYLYGNVAPLSSQQIEEVKQLLIAQKKHVDVYTSTRVEELLASSSCPLAVGSSADVFKVMREYNNIEFVLPQEGTFATLDSFVIPHGTQKDDLVYEFINFLYEHKVVEHNSNKYGFCSPLLAHEQNNKLCPDEMQFKKLHFFKNVLTSEQIQNIWIAVKAH